MEIAWSVNDLVTDLARDTQMTISKRARLGVMAALLCLYSAAGNAQQISASVETVGSTGPLTASDTSNVPGTVSAFQTDPSGPSDLSFMGPSFVRAIQDSDGNAAVSVSGVFAGGAVERTMTAQAVFEEVVTNSAALPQTVTMNFEIAPIVLKLDRSAGYGTTFAANASYQIDIEQNGSGIFASGAALNGFDNLVQLFDDADTDPASTSLGGVVSGPDMGPGLTVADFPAYSGSIDLGVLDPGASTTIIYTMLARFNGPETESGGAASIGDPLEFDMSPGTTIAFEFSGAPSMGAMGIDVRPWNRRNHVNPNSWGAVPVAILGSADFDVTMVDDSTITLGVGEAPPFHVSHPRDFNRDGFVDKLFFFKTKRTGIECGDTEVSLTGQTLAGESISGSDSIKTLGCKKS